MSEHDRYADDVGAYLLGALEPDEHAAFERHARGCERCRRDVARLSLARDALPGSVEQLAPPPRLRAALMETVRAEAANAGSGAAAPDRAAAPSRWLRWRELLLSRPQFAAAAAALLLAVGIGLGALVGALGGRDDAQRTIAGAVDSTRAPAGAKASLVLGDEGGAQLRVKGMSQPRPGQVYEVWIKRGDRLVPSSLFTVERDGSGTAGIPDDLTGADAVLVTREPAAGSTKPSEAPLVTVRVRS